MIGWNASKRYHIDKKYPPYYKSVFIVYKFPRKSKEIAEAWLSVNDKGEYIWTLSDDTTIIPDKYVINWIENK